MSEFALVVPTAAGFALAPEFAKSLKRRTPKSMLEKDKKSGMDYVKVGYVRRRLDEHFPFSWDFEVELVTPWDVVSKTKQLAVKGRLTLKHPLTGQTLRVLENYGGCAVKTYAKDHALAGQVLDLGNDLKGAEADALKKCASMVGICQDVFEPKVERDLAASPER